MPDSLFKANRWRDLSRLRGTEYQVLQYYNTYTKTWIDLASILGTPRGLLVSLTFTDDKCFLERSVAKIETARRKGEEMVSGFLQGFLNPAITRTEAVGYVEQLESALDNAQLCQRIPGADEPKEGSWSGYQLITPAQDFYTLFAQARDKIKPLECPKF